MTVFMTVIVAYSCGAANYTGGSNEMCLMWSSELTDLQEEYQDGLTIFVRSTPSDIELTSKDCKPCGTYTIPYPLCTSVDCGDPSYFNFHCNVETGPDSFLTSNGTFKVTSTDLEKKDIFHLRYQT
ncbi:hypothetical protein SOVF_088540 isoform A [Spinacia oleracea]|uniref:Uncharacterized protein isoform X3 n=1 Tax=Spinacia oleracea TaxID=3562 RepID=A0ABM3RKK8_SPIOL|nr:uncharacterized protein LOC110796686 isoform X3 [Spinacia oleracea]XP_056696149.1 uncharacterized protein LOC110792819 isoform X4 [Spinacia oleracea]KNA16502.1 hypothetical protein SOVF_088540 isoform A [Spinacia oleracea]